MAVRWCSSDAAQSPALAAAIPATVRQSKALRINHAPVRSNSLVSGHSEAASSFLPREASPITELPSADHDPSELTCPAIGSFQLRLAQASAARSSPERAKRENRVESTDPAM